VSKATYTEGQKTVECMSLHAPGTNFQQVEVEVKQAVRGQGEFASRVGLICYSHTCAPLTSYSAQPDPEITEADIQAQIQALFRQITASVTFLPQLDGNCTFNVLVYADADSDVPMEWGDSDAKEIKNGEKVQLRSFSTSNHRVDTIVSYRLAD
jgi:hypothetical protein